MGHFNRRVGGGPDPAKTKTVWNLGARPSRGERLTRHRVVSVRYGDGRAVTCHCGATFTGASDSAMSFNYGRHTGRGSGGTLEAVGSDPGVPNVRVGGPDV